VADADVPVECLTFRLASTLAPPRDAVLLLVY